MPRVMRRGFLTASACGFVFGCAGPEPPPDVGPDTALAAAIKEEGPPASRPRGDAIMPARAIPPYRVVFKQRMIAPPGVLVEVVVPSLSKSTPQAKVASIALAILRREGGDRMNIYATEAAFRANEDSDFGDKHPGALNNGFLGRIENGTFVPPPAWMR